MNKFYTSSFHTFLISFLVTSLLFLPVVLVSEVYAASVTLTATVATTLSFTTSTSQFPSITSGVFVFATTTLDVSTNDTSGWFITLSGDNKSTANNNLEMSGNTSVQIPDQTEWINGSATTSAGNAVIRTSFANSGNVLAFRVMSASSTNGGAFASTAWWGNNDNDGTALWAGIASSTVARQIGNSGTGSYSATKHLNTIQYYVSVSSGQQAGTYTAPLTLTAVGN
jgi:hypothetical protein